MTTAFPINLQLGHPKILVLGDAMLDRYTWGNAERVSPEAPVLVLRADQREVRLGGAASVAVLFRALEVEATLATVIGDDHDGRTIRRLIDDAGIDATPLLIDSGRPTTTKERFLGRSDQRQAHQMLRVDTESRDPVDNELTARLLNALARLIPQHDAVLISDYGKGVCTEFVVAEVISICRAAEIPVLVDPARGVDFAIYRGATLLKPNRLEAELAIGRSIRTPNEASEAANVLRQRYEVDSVVITLDRDGLVVATAEGTEHQTIEPRAICDITGAGDTVLATLGVGLASGLSLTRCARLANIAAGLQVAQPGVTPISRTELLQAFHQQTNSGNPKLSQCLVPNNEISNPPKLITFEVAQYLANEYRRTGRRIVFTNGCFDLLHVGHVSMLEESATLGDVLFVAINSDASVRNLKGGDRPVIAEKDRARMLSALACVNHVLIFGDATPHRLLHAIRPDILVKGGTTHEIVGREVVEAYGGRVERSEEILGLSTTRLVQRMRAEPALTEDNP